MLDLSNEVIYLLNNFLLYLCVLINIMSSILDTRNMNNTYSIVDLLLTSYLRRQLNPNEYKQYKNLIVILFYLKKRTKLFPIDLIHIHTTNTFQYIHIYIHTLQIKI